MVNTLLRDIVAQAPFDRKDHKHIQKCLLWEVMAPGAFILPYYLATFVCVSEFLEDVRCGGYDQQTNKQLMVMRPALFLCT